MRLLVDIGNTRIKWASHDSVEFGPQGAEAHGGWGLSEMQRHITMQASAPERILVSNVAGSHIAAIFTEAALQAWGLRPVFVHSTAEACGVRNAYAEPGKLGVDRWIGMIAAHHSVPRAVCVVSVGTAMTIDGLDANGQHLGGLITPGPQLMVRSLLGGTSDIAARVGALQLTDAVFGSNTATAIHNGARHALAALIVRAAEWTHQQAGEQPTVILTGGASELIEPLLPWPASSVPDLVLRGLAILEDG